MKIRNAVAADAGGIAAIYNEAVRDTTAIWNDVEVNAANRAEWMTARQADGFPVLVAESTTGEVAGYATYGPFRPHDGYRHTAELSLYVDSAARGAGLGGRLLAALVARAEAGGIHVLIGAVEAGNAASIALHRRHGFREAGRLSQVGTKFGRWLDLVLMERVLDQSG